jgi:hypothetical protein
LAKDASAGVGRSGRGRASPHVVCANATVHVLGQSAFVICEEVVAETLLIATNVFVVEQGAWKLAHHQAAPVATDTVESVALQDEDGQALN